MTTTLDQVDEALAHIEETITATRSRWEAERRVASVTVFAAVDGNGRPLLADLLAAKANLMAARVQLAGVV